MKKAWVMCPYLHWTQNKYILNVSLSKNTMGHKLKDCRSNTSNVAYRHVLFVSHGV